MDANQILALRACEGSGHAMADHFVDVNKTIDQALFGKSMQAMKAVPQTLLSRGIRPESLPPAEDGPDGSRRAASMGATSTKAAGRKPSGNAQTNAPTPDGSRRTASMGAEGRKPFGNAQTIERRLTADEKKALKNPDTLEDA